MLVAGEDPSLHVGSTPPHLRPVAPTDIFGLSGVTRPAWSFWASQVNSSELKAPQGNSGQLNICYKCCTQSTFPPMTSFSSPCLEKSFEDPPDPPTRYQKWSQQKGILVRVFWSLSRLGPQGGPRRPKDPSGHPKSRPRWSRELQKSTKDTPRTAQKGPETSKS